MAYSTCLVSILRQRFGCKEFTWEEEVRWEKKAVSYEWVMKPAVSRAAGALRDGVIPLES